MGNSGGGGGGGGHVHHYVQKADPEVERKAREAKEKAERLAKEAEEEKKAENLKKSLDKQFQNVIDNVSKMELTQSIEKRDGERHICFMGNISSGKTTMQNVMFNLSNPVALGDCTSGCEKVYSNDGLVVWDVSGDNASFQYFKTEKLEFIKSLDRCVVLFDSDVASIKWFLKLVHAVNPDSLMVVRTKVDQHDVSNSRTVYEERDEDGKKVQEILGMETSFKTYCVSSHNVKNDGERYDWDVFYEKLTKSLD